MYTLRLLGGFALLDSLGKPVQRLAQRRAEAVLALLALSGDLGCTRDRLVGLLWAESDEPHARHSLRNVLHALRVAVGPDAALACGDILRLNPAVIDADVQRFAGLLQQSRPEDAVQCYRGPLLDGFHIDEAQEFDLWLEQERARLYRECAEALETLATRAEQARDWRSAASSWQRAAEHDPHNSRLVISLMRALAAVGDLANALLFAEAHRRRLRKELEIEPGTAFEAEVARLRHESGYRHGALLDASCSVPGDALRADGTPRDAGDGPRW